MVYQNDIFVPETMTFFKNVSTLITIGPSLRYRGIEQFYLFQQRFFEILNSKITELALYETLKARAEEFNIPENNTDVIDLLFLELNYYNTRYDYIQMPDSVIEISRIEAIDSADAVVGSID